MNTQTVKNKYPDYDRVAGYYDKTRPPVGVELILRAFSEQKTPLADMCVLDAGCGTGNYSQALIGCVGSVVGLDISKGMIALARQKILGDGRTFRLTFTVGAITHLPFRAATFDAIMVNQVLHHLRDESNEGFPKHRMALYELARVLRPGGIIAISTSSQEQCKHGFWFYHLIPKAAEQLRHNFIPLPDLMQMLNNSGFRYRNQQVPRELVLQGDAYFNPQGPLHKAWRVGDSAWARATEEELDQCLATIRRFDEQGKLDEQFKKWDAIRQRIGQVTFLFASRESYLARTN